MQEKEIKEHTIYKYADKVNQICEDLLANTPVNLFCYARSYKNGDYSVLLTDKHWAYFYLKNDLQEVGVEPQLASHTQGHYFFNLSNIQPSCPASKFYIEACIHFKHGSGVIFAEEFQDYREVSIFTTENDLYNDDPYLVENISILKQFILYFKEKLHADNELYHAFLHRYKNKLISDTPVVMHKKEKVSFSIKRYYLGGHFNEIPFTKREAQCLKYLAQNKTLKEIAIILELSPRTIETYVEKIKFKTNCKTLPELLLNLKSSNLLDGIE